MLPITMEVVVITIVDESLETTALVGYDIAFVASVAEVLDDIAVSEVDEVPRIVEGEPVD